MAYKRDNMQIPKRNALTLDFMWFFSAYNVAFSGAFLASAERHCYAIDTFQAGITGGFGFGGCGSGGCGSSGSHPSGL